MAETSSLLNCRTGNRTTSSNLVLSALRNQFRAPHASAAFVFVCRPSKARFRKVRHAKTDSYRYCSARTLIACGVTRRARAQPELISSETAPLLRRGLSPARNQRRLPDYRLYQVRRDDSGLQLQGHRPRPRHPQILGSLAVLLLGHKMPNRMRPGQDFSRPHPSFFPFFQP